MRLAIRRSDRSWPERHVSRLCEIQVWMDACRHELCVWDSPCANAIPCTIDRVPICRSTVRLVQGAVASGRQVSVQSVYCAVRRRARRMPAPNR
eukprot:2183889-Pleurochrysis_carterae.AAC.1